MNPKQVNQLLFVGAVNHQLLCTIIQSTLNSQVAEQDNVEDETINMSLESSTEKFEQIQ